MASITEIRAALAASVATTGLRAFPIAPGQISPPAAIVRPARGTLVSYQQTTDGATDMTFEVVILLSAANERDSQAQLDGYLSMDQPASVWAALHADETLGGLVSYAYVDHAANYAYMEYAGTDYLGVTMTVVCGAP